MYKKDIVSINPIKKIINASILGIFGGFLNASINLITLPILMSIYGKQQYGLIGIALACNSFLQILSMGVPTGATKYFSEWLISGKIKNLIYGVQSNLLFFTIIGFLNSSILFFLSQNTSEYFNVTNSNTLSKLLIVLSLSSFINWYFLTLQQLLAAYEMFFWTNIHNIIANLLTLSAMLIAYLTKCSIEIYFSIYIMCMLSTSILNLVKCLKLNIIKLRYYIPIFRKDQFRVIIAYSSTLFMIGILQYLANQSQPIILATLGKDGDILVANFKIIQNVTMLVTMMAGVFLQNFLPHITKINFKNNKSELKEFVLESTKWLSVCIFFICIFIVFNSENILNVYVGEDGKGLSLLLSFWILGILFQNNQGISAVIIATGKFKPLIFSLLIASISSIIISIVFINEIGLAVVPIGFVLYKIIESISIYLYYVPKVIDLKPLFLFKASILKPLILSFISILFGFLLMSSIELESIYNLIISGLVDIIVYLGLISIFILNKNDLTLLNRILKGKLYSKIS